MTPLRHSRPQANYRQQARKAQASIWRSCGKDTSPPTDPPRTTTRKSVIRQDREAIAEDVIYHGWRKPDGQFAVIVEPKPGSYEPLRHIKRHSPNGFAWGYEGNGPRDLALSLLTDALSDHEPFTERPSNEYDSNQVNLTNTQRSLEANSGSSDTDLLYLRFTADVITHLPQNRSWLLLRSEILYWAEDSHRPIPPTNSPLQQPPTPCNSSARRKPARSRRSRRP